MKNARMTIWMVTTVLVMTAGQGFGLTEFKDGGIYNINYTINDNVSVDNGAPAMQTTFNLLSGGTVSSPYLLQGYESSKLNIAGGSAYQIKHHGPGSITISAGTVGSLYCSNIYVANSLIMTGGQVNYLNDGVGSMTISGGAVDILDVDGDGGIASGLVTINGYNFAINGNPVSFGQYFKSDFASGNLTGTLANGDALDTQFYINYSASITLVPEPTTICLLAIGSLALIRKKK